MSETSSNEPTSAAEESTPESDTEETTATHAPASHAADAPAPHESRMSRWLAPAALLLAVIAIAGAAVGWFFPNKSATSTTPTYSDQQTKDQKKRVCETFMVVDRAVVRNSRLKNPDNGGPIGALSVATAARLAFYGGGAYLKDVVAQSPAAPADLTKSVNAMANNLEELAIGYLAGAADFTQDELRQALDDKIKQTVEICKK